MKDEEIARANRHQFLEQLVLRAEAIYNFQPPARPWWKLRERNPQPPETPALVADLRNGAPPDRCRPMQQLWPRHHRLVSLPVVHPGQGPLPEMRQALVISAPRFLTSRHSAG